MRGCEERVVTGDAEQAQAHHQHAGDGAALEGDLQRGVEAVVGRFGGAHVGAHRDVHADVAGEAREDGADREAACRVTQLSAKPMTTNSTTPTIVMVVYWRLR